MKPRILLGIDRPGWTLDRVADQLIRYLSNDFDFARAYFAPPASLRGPEWEADYECVVAMHWPALTLMREMLPNVTNAAGVACVYDHYALRRQPDLLTKVACLSDMLILANDKMLQEMVELAPLPRVKTRVCKDGVDREQFRLIARDRGDGPLVIGWCGNSEGSGDDGKGLGIIRSMCAANGWGLVSLDAASGPTLPHADMRGWYEGLDCYVCASDAEGTPNPVLEALSCGVPTASTNVGVAREAGACIAEAKCELDLARAVAEARREGTVLSDGWDWSDRVEAWRSALKEVLA